MFVAAGIASLRGHYDQIDFFVFDFSERKTASRTEDTPKWRFLAICPFWAISQPRAH